MKTKTILLYLLGIISINAQAQETVVNDDLVYKWVDELQKIQPDTNCIIIHDLFERNTYTDEIDTIRTVQHNETEIVFRCTSEGAHFVRINMEDNTYPLYDGEVQVGMAQAHLEAILKTSIYKSSVIVTDITRHATFLFVLWEGNVILIQYNFYYGG